MALHIHHGPHLQALTESLSTLLAVPLPDPFAPEVIAVPTAGMRDWLQQQLSLRLGAAGRSDGVAANIEMVFPGRFVRSALGQPLSSDDPWDIDHLTWAVLQTLESNSVAVPGRPEVTSPSSARYTTARRIADLFDGYANNRPQLLQQWVLGHNGDGTLDDNGAVVPLPADQHWQPELWRQVRALIGTPSSAELLPGLLAALAQGNRPTALPARVAVFGISAVAPGQLSVLTALATALEVHLYVLHPSVVAWKNCRQQLGGRLVPRASCNATAAVRHPLLRSWARPSMEVAALLGDVPNVQFHHHPAPDNPTTPSLLRQIQADLTADHPPDGSFPLSAPPQQPDDSVQVHACHGTTRQLEVLRDALGHLFAADPTLTPHQVVVVCPDLARFAPLVASVFQRGDFPVPVQVSDLSLGADNPVGAAVSAILTVTAGRCTASDLLGLCALAPVRQRLGITNDDITLIDQWITDLGTSWGLDSDQRSEWLPPHITEGTWASTLDRLLLGAAMPAPNPRVGPGEVAPFDDIDASSLRTAGLLAELVARLRLTRSATSVSHNIHDWADILTGIIGSLCATEPTDAWQLAQVLENIGALRQQSLVGGTPCDVALTLTDIRAMLGGLLGAQTGRLNLRSGSVTVTAMVPVRNLPARVVCVLGLDEASLRSGGTDGDDVLGARPCVGERDQRSEGRHLLLDALMAAGEHLIITFDGSDITTNRLLPAPVQLAELFDIVAASIAPSATTAPAPLGSAAPGSVVSSTGPRDVAVLRRHPRQAYDERNFSLTQLPGDHVAPFGFDGRMLAAAMDRRSAQPAEIPVASLAPLIPATVTLAQLSVSCSHPARTYLLDRLDARLPREPDEIDDEIPLAVSSLEIWRLGTALLELHRSPSAHGSIGQWRAAQHLLGGLPPRALATAALDEVEGDVARLLDAAPNLRLLATHHDSQHIDLRISVPAAPGGVRLIDLITHVSGDTLVCIEFKRPAPRYEIAAALALASAVVTDPSRGWHALVVTRATSGSKPTLVHLQPIDSPDRVLAARHLLSVALEIHLQALCQPLPLFECSSRDLYDTRHVTDDTLQRDLGDASTRFFWGQHTLDDILAPGGDGRAEQFADLLWGAFRRFLPSSQSGSDTDADDDQGDA